MKTQALSQTDGHLNGLAVDKSGKGIMGLISSDDKVHKGFYGRTKYPNCHLHYTFRKNYTNLVTFERIKRRENGYLQGPCQGMYAPKRIHHEQQVYWGGGRERGGERGRVKACLGVGT